jgi:hypothetical protein
LLETGVEKEDNPMSDPESSTHKLIRTWQPSTQDSPGDSHSAIWDLALGGALLGAVGGAIAGAALFAAIDQGGMLVLGFAGAVVGAIGVALVGLLVGLIGHWLMGWLGLEQRIRARRGGRLLRAGVVGALGGPLIHILLRGLGVGIGGFVAAGVIGLVFWTVCGAIGVGVGTAIDRWRRPKQVQGQ